MVMGKGLLNGNGLRIISILVIPGTVPGNKSKQGTIIVFLPRNNRKQQSFLVIGYKMESQKIMANCPLVTVSKFIFADLDGLSRLSQYL